MDIKEILVIVDLYGKRAGLDPAIELAARTSAYLTGVSFVYQPMIPIYGMAPVPADFIATALQSARSDADAAIDAFRKAAERAGVKYEARTTELMPGAGFDEILAQCRLTDLVVIDQPNPDQPEPLRTPLIEAILFNSGAPALVIPYIGTSRFKLDKVLIAWDGGAPAARAVHAAMPLLGLARQVEVLMISNTPLGDEAGTDLARYLARHGLKPELRQTSRGDIGVADVLLNFVADNAYDWVVMGAYGHNRLREMVFGGATRDVLSEMTVPVLMTH